jgi:NAD-dependent SIR2 family protein deacetylase
VKVAESKADSSKIRFYEAGSSNDPMSVFKSFLESGAEHFQGGWSSFCRGKPLLSFEPTSFFGPNVDSEEQMAVFRELIIYVYSIADNFGVDVAICIPQEETYSSVEALRNDLCPFTGGPFWMLSESQKANASRLAGDAKIGRLSVFVGAGISKPSGGPSWGGLLESLAIKAGMSEDDRESLAKLDYLDQPTILAEEMGDDFKPAIAEVITESSRYTPAHALLKTLKAPAVTTNYDDLYEAAAASCGDYLPTLPWQSREMIQRNHDEKNSLLKLHGCIKHPESIILSRGDYMRYPDTSQALRGRLHGVFLTTEVLFCGFSMTDDNVHKVIDDIRKVVYENGEPTDHKFGTILSMRENKMFNRLWDQDFHLQSFGLTWDDNPAWFHDCFLDYMVSSYVKKD